MYRTESVAGLSPHMLALALASSVLWTLHGLRLRDAALVVAGVLAAAVNALILEKYRRVARQQGAPS